MPAIACSRERLPCCPRRRTDISSASSATTQDEVLAVAKGYRERHLPADMIVVDWFYYSKMGQMDMDPPTGPIRWP